MNPHSRLPGRRQQTQIANQSVLHADALKQCQILFQLRHFPIVDDPGQHHRQPPPLNQKTGHFRVGGQNVQGHIEHGGFGIEQVRGQLLPGGDLDGQAGQVFWPPIVGDAFGRVDGKIRPPGPQGGKLIEHIPAHGVDGGGGDNKAWVNPGAHLHAAVGRAAGFGYPLGKHFPGQGNIPSQLRPGAVDGTGAAFRVSGGQGTAVHSDHRPEFQVNQRSFPRLKGLPCRLEPLGIVPGVLADAKHFPIDPAGVIAVGEALTVEGGHEGVHHGFRDLALVNGLPVHGGDGGYILGFFHPAFQLHGGHAHAFQFA